jgi:hypothetical protein
VLGLGGVSLVDRFAGLKKAFDDELMVVMTMARRDAIVFMLYLSRMEE